MRNMFKDWWLINCLMILSHLAQSQCPGNTSFSFSGLQCSGNSIVFTNTSTNVGTDQFVWKWNDGTGETGPVGTSPQNHSFSNQGTYTVTLERTCGNNKQVSNLQIQIVDYPQKPTFSASPNNGCANEPVNFSITNIQGGSSYSWNFGDPESGTSNTASGTTATHFFSPKGTPSSFTVKATATNTQGCVTESDPFTLNTKSTPQINIIDNDPLFATGGNFTRCQLDGNSVDSVYTFTFSNNSISDNPSTQFTWNWGDGSPVTIVTNKSEQTHEYKRFGVSNLILTAFNPISGCTSRDTIQVVNEKFPSASLVIPTTDINICDNQTITVTNNSLNATSYIWRWGDGDSTVTNNKSPASHKFNLSDQDACTINSQLGKQITVTLIAKNSCFQHNNNSPVSVRPVPRPSFLTNPASKRVCKTSPDSEHNVIFTPSVCPSRTISGFPTTLTFDFGDGFNSGPDNLNTQTILPNQPLTAAHRYKNPGKYAVKLTATNSCGSSTFIDTIYVLDPAIASFTNGLGTNSSNCGIPTLADFTPASNCGPFTVNLFNTSTNLTFSDNISWTVNPSTGATFGSSNSGSSGSSNDNLSFTQPGSYIINLSVSNQCNAVPSTACAMVKVSGIPSINANNTSIGGLGGVVNPNFTFSTTGPNANSWVACGTQSVTTLTVVNPDTSVKSYNWNIVGTNGTANPVVVGANQQTLGNTTLGVGTYQINASVTNKCGTANLPLQNVTITNPPTVNTGGTIPAGGNSQCPGSVNIPGKGAMKELVVCSGVVANLGAGASQTGVTYNWTTSSGNTPVSSLTTIQTTVTITNPTNENTCHKYFLEADNGACKSKDSILVVVKPAPLVNIGVINSGNASGDTSICVGQTNFPLYASPLGGSWTGVSSANIVTPAGVFRPDSAGIGLHTVKYTYTDPIPGGCTIEKNKTIRIFPLPLVSLSLDDEYCESTIPFTISASPAGGVWSSSINSSVTSLGELTTSIIGAGNSATLTYQVTDANGCTNSQNKSISITPPAKAIPGLDQEQCANEGVFNLTGASPAGGVWSGIGLAATKVSSIGLFDPVGLSAGEYEVKYTINLGTPCQKDSIKKVIIKPVPTVSPGGTYGPFCEDDAAVPLLASPRGGTWSGPGVVINETDTLFNPKLAGASTGHVITYSYTNSVNCTAITTTTIEVKSLPVVNAGIDRQICTNINPYPLTGYSPTTGGIGTWSLLNASTNTINASTGSYLPNVVTIDTIEYKFSLPSGCFRSDTLIITVVSPVQADAGTDTVICLSNGITTLLPGTSTPFNPTLGSSWSGQGIISGTSNFNPQLLNNSSLNTDITLTYSYGLDNCVTTDTKLIKVFAQPTIDPPSNPNGVLCEDVGAIVISGYSARTLGVSSFDSTYGIWTGMGVSKIPNSNRYIFDPAQAGPSATEFVLTYTYTDSSTNNCVSTLTSTVSVAPLPIADFTIPTLNCSNTTLNVVNNSTISIGTLSKNNWNFGETKPGSIKTNENHGNTSYIYDVAGVFTISLEVISLAGCKDTVAKSIRVIDPPVSKFSYRVNPANGCGPLAVSIQDLSVGYDSTYSWNFGNLTTSNSFIPNDTTITYLPGIISDTTYYITLTVYNQCKPLGDVFTDSIKVLPKPLANFGTDKSVGCSPAPFNFNNLSLGKIKGSPTVYYWKFSDGQPTVGPQESFLINGTLQEPHPGTKYFTYVGRNDTTYQITLIAENICGIDSIKKSIKVLPNTVRAFFNQSVNDGCSPLSVNFTDFSTGGNFVAYDFGDGNSIVSKNHQHVFNNNGTTPVTFTVKQFVNNGCSYDTTEQTITVNPIPKVNFSIFKNELCQYEESEFTNLSTGVDHSVWNFGDGTPELSNLLSKVNHVYNTSGTFNVTLIGKENKYLCADTVSKTIQVNAPPTVDYSLSDTAGCQPLNVQFSNNSSTDVKGFSWKFGDGNTSALVNPNHLFSNFGIFTVKLLATNDKGCKDSSSAKVTVYEKPKADFQILNESNPCVFPVEIGLQNNSSTVSVGFSWLVDGTQVSTLNQPTLSLPTPKTYVLDLVATSADGCTDTKRLTKEIYPLPTAVFTLSDSTGCTPHEVVFTNLSQNANQYKWFFGTGASSSNPTKEVKHLYPIGEYQVQLVAISPVGCTDTLTSVPNVITVRPRPKADFAYEPNTDPALYGTMIFSDLSFDAVSRLWEMGDGTQYTHDSTLFSHRYQLFGDKTIRLVITNEFGCTDEKVRTIEVPFFGNLFVPSAFSPSVGEDGVRTFKPIGIGLEKYKIQVFDMWGILVWESDKIDGNSMPEEGWDGTKDGVPMPQDTYIWKVEATFKGGRGWQGMEYKKGKFKTSGTVTLLR